MGVGTYTLAESPTDASADTDGYVTEGWSCDSVEPVTFGPEGTATLVLGPEDTDVTCTIENTWQGGTLTLVKDVEGGAAAPSDWTLSAQSPTGAVAAEGISGTPAVTERPVLAGTYRLGESPAAEGAPADLYAGGEWSCQGGSVDGDRVQVGVGANVVCTVTNTYDPATLTLVKDVVGGNAQPTDWELAAEGPRSIRGVTGDTTITSASLPAGSYELSENPVAGAPVEGYTAQG